MLKIHSILIFIILTNWMDFSGLADLIAVQELSIPLTRTDAKENLRTKCTCKYKCYVLNCTTYSVTQSDDGMECRVSTRPVPRYLWEDAPNSYTVHKSDYIARGRHFYRVTANSPLTQTQANDSCMAEGGQLPVLIDSASIAEFQSLLSYLGLEKAWLGAYRAYDVQDGVVVGNEPPVWILANGTTIEDPTLPVFATYRCFIFNPQIDKMFDNTFICNEVLTPICQRDY